MKLPKDFKPKVVIFSLIALGFVALTFLVNPYFIVGAIVFMLLGQRELGRKRGKEIVRIEKASIV